MRGSTNLVEDGMIVLDWSQECLVGDYDDPSFYLTETSGNIHLEDPLHSMDHIIGKFNLFYLDVVSMMNNPGEICIFDALDTHQQTSVFYEPLYGGCEPDFSEAVFARVDSIDGFNLLILDRLEILPEYRGGGTGLLVMRELIRRFGWGAGIVAIKPFPLQFEARETTDKLDDWGKSMQFEVLPRDEKKCTKKLRQYYEELGFKKLGQSPLMVLSTSWRMPNAQSLARPRTRLAAEHKSSMPRPESAKQGRL